MPSSRGSSRPRDRTQASCTAGGFFTVWVIREAHSHLIPVFLFFLLPYSQVKSKTEDSIKVMSFQVEKMVEDASEYRGAELSSQDWAERGGCGRRAGPGFSRLSSAN